MKRQLAILLALLMLLSLAACGNQTKQKEEQESAPTTEETGTEEANEAVQDEEQEEEEEEVQGLSPLVGGWTIADSPVVTDQVKALMEKAFSEFEGVTYVPVAYISSQVVAGTNHSILCKTIPEGAESGTYSIAVLYEDLEGNVEVMNMMESGAEASLESLEGGWYDPDSPELTSEVLDVFEKAAESVTDTAYTPLALVGCQVVAGMNYCILCQSQNVTLDGENGLALVYVYGDLEGNGEITDIVPFALNKG